MYKRQLEGGHVSTLSDATSATLYRICQEALNNAQKYAQASRLEIDIKLGDEVELKIQDNGIGFKLQDSQKGFGLKGMQERVQALGGRFNIRSYSQHESEQHGTSIRVELPGI